MVINVHAGHNANAAGAVGLIDEQVEARRVKNLVISKLRSLAYTVNDTTDEAGLTQRENLQNIVYNSNSHPADLEVSIHFNAGANDLLGDGVTTGTEVLVYSLDSASLPYARQIVQDIAALGFTDRGVTERPRLYVLRNTRAPALLVECCFVDDADDVALYRPEAMADAIVDGITQVVSRRYTAQFQMWLNDTYNAGLVVDGIWGPRTRAAAIRAFQTELNDQFGADLDVDGIWGPKTQAAAVNVRRGARGNLTRIIQGALYARGYDAHGFDGIFGPGCERAVRAFQHNSGLWADGIVGPNTWAALLS